MIKSRPGKGERVERGDKIDIVLSKGPEMVKMPSVVGLSKNEALNKLEKVGLKDVAVEQTYNANTPKGYIANQNVAANKQVKLNDHNIKFMNHWVLDKFTLVIMKINHILQLKST